MAPTRKNDDVSKPPPRKNDPNVIIDQMNTDDAIEKLCELMKQRGITITINKGDNHNNSMQIVDDDNDDDEKINNSDGSDGSDDSGYESDSEIEFDSSMTGIYEYERIIKYRFYKEKHQLFVKWKNFDSSNNSWISLDDLKCKPIITGHEIKGYVYDRLIPTDELEYIKILIKNYYKNRSVNILNHQIINNQLVFTIESVDPDLDLSYVESFDEMISNGHYHSLKSYILKNPLKNLNVFYARVSSKQQSGDNHVSLDAQIQSMLFPNNGEVIIVKEIASGRITFNGTGAAMTRKIYQRKLEFLANHLLDSEIFVYSIDRFSRNTVFGIDLLERMTKNNTKFTSVTEGVSFTTDTNKNIIRNALSSAELQSDTISSKVRMAINHNRLNNIVRIAPYGFNKDGSVNPAENAIITELNGLYHHDTMTYDDMVDMLKARNLYKRGRTWSPNIVRNIIIAANINTKIRNIPEQIEYVNKKRKENAELKKTLTKKKKSKTVRPY